MRPISRALASIALIITLTYGCLACAGELGANKFDLLLQYTGRASGGDGSPAYLRITQAMARKAILDAADAGFTFFRVSVTGYSPSAATDTRPNDLSLWLTNPPAYWGLVDRMFDDLDRAGIRLVPTFVWNLPQFPAVTNETEGALIRDAHSKSRALLERYVGEFIDRYKARKTILFYDLTNELNLRVDLDLRRRCLESAHEAAQCSVADKFTTGQMIEFSRDMVSFIKQRDPGRLVSSGYSFPRRSSYHLERQPEFSPAGPDWAPDTIEQFRDYLSRTQAPFDIVDVHVYQNPKDVRYGRPADREYEFVADAAAVARADHKKLFVGEFGDDGGSSLTPYIVKATAANTVDYAAVWVWEYYQSTTKRSFDTEPSRLSLEPGFTDARIAALTASLPKPALETGASPGPRVVLTWPLPCSRVGGTVDVFAVASGPLRDPIDHVDFFADGKVLGSASMPPFHVSFEATSPGDKEVTLEAHAVTSKGLSSTFRSTALLNHAVGSCFVAGD